MIFGFLYNDFNIWCLFLGLFAFIFSITFSILEFRYSIKYLNIIKTFESNKGLSIKICIVLNALSLSFILFSLFIFSLEKLLELLNY